MKIDFSCPVELLNVEYKSGECRFQVNNLSENMLTGIDVEAATYDGDGFLLDIEKTTFNDLSVFQKEPKELELIIENHENVDFVELDLLSAHFEKGIAWHSGVLNEFNYTIDVLDGEALHVLKLLAGEDAITYPSEQGDLWVCTCGRANRIDDDFCIRCGRVKEEMFRNITKEKAKEAQSKLTQQKTEENRQVRMEAEIIKTKQKEKEERSKKRRRIQLRLIIAAAAVLVILALGLIFGRPYYLSLQANKLLEAGQYEAALQQLQSLPASYNIEARTKEVRYAMAVSYFEQNTIDSLKAAREIFAALGDYEQSAEYVRKCDYQTAELLLAQGSNEEAAVLYSSISDYADAALKVKQAKYNIAVEMLENSQYAEAKAAFEELGNYLDSADRIRVADYNLGLAALEAGEYQTAIDYFKEILGYQDSEERYYEASYGLANQYYAQKKFADAGALYLVVSQSKSAAAKYPDALTKARLTLYQEGKLALINRDYETAARLLESILDYLDSYTLYLDAQVALANQALQKGDTETALERLTEFEGQEKAAAVINKVKYQQAEALLKEGKKQEAAALFAEIVPYSDSQTRYQAVSYSIAEDHLEAGEYDAAIEGFAALGEYSDSVQRANESRYAKAQSLMEAGSFTEAAEIFLALGEYSDAQTKAQTAVISSAKELVANKQYEQAEKLIERIAGVQGADELLAEVRYLIATAYIEQSEYEKALNVLNQIENYKDVETLKQQTRFSAAEQLANEGATLRAAWLYADLGDYKDAALRADKLFNEAYESVAQSARRFNTAKDYQQVYETLKDYDLSRLPTKFEDLISLYQNAVYTLANQAYAEKNAFVAYRYYKLIPDYLDVSDRLEAWTYRVLGTWKTADGELAIFNEDGSASINGKDYKLYFVEGYTLQLGDSVAALETLYNMSNRGATRFTLRERSGARGSYIYNKESSAEQPAEEKADTPATTEGGSGKIVPIPLP